MQLTGQILAKHPALIIGDSALSTCATMAPLLTGGPLQFCLSPGFVPPPFGTAYSIGTSPPLQSAAILTYARAHGWTRLAMLNQNDATGDSVLKSTNDEFVKPINTSIPILANERFSPGDISIAAQLSRIRAADAQVIVSYNSGAPFGIVVRGLRDSYVELKAFGESLPRRLFFVSGPLPPDGPEIENGPLKATDLNFLEAFRRQGLRPDWGNATAWDTGSIVIAALRACGLDGGPKESRSYINTLHGLPAIQGMADFRSGDGRGVSDGRILAWDRSRNTWSIASGPGGSPKH